MVVIKIFLNNSRKLAKVQTNEEKCTKNERMRIDLACSKKVEVNGLSRSSWGTNSRLSRSGLFILVEMLIQILFSLG